MNTSIPYTDFVKLGEHAYKLRLERNPFADKAAHAYFVYMSEDDILKAAYDWKSGYDSAHRKDLRN